MHSFCATLPRRVACSPPLTAVHVSKKRCVHVSCSWNKQSISIYLHQLSQAQKQTDFIPLLLHKHGLARVQRVGPPGARKLFFFFISLCKAAEGMRGATELRDLWSPFGVSYMCLNIVHIDLCSDGTPVLRRIRMNRGVSRGVVHFKTLYIILIYRHISACEGCSFFPVCLSGSI